ncbi:MAG: hypothetical protein M0030_08040 [Actinomycetota bacterium]|nr:hypothetical protein [Actinomycetota bacterium]
MTHRRPEPGQAGLEDALRRALRAAADSVEPAAGGLDRIRAKIAVRRMSRSVGWAMADLPSGPLHAARHRTARIADWARGMLRDLGDRLGPLGGAARGGLGWLRPAAALATGLAVVAVASWMVTALPQTVTTTNNSAGVSNSPGGPRAVPAHSASRRATDRPSAGSSRSARPLATASCTPSAVPHRRHRRHRPGPSPKPSVSASPSVTPSPTPSPTGTPSPSPSPSASPSTSPSTQPTAGGPSTGPTAGTATPSTRTGKRHNHSTPPTGPAPCRSS